MLVSRGRNPNASEVIGQLITNPGLRSRVLTTLGLLLLVRLGIYIPMPGIDREAFKQFIDQGGQLIGFLDIFTGGGISTLGIFALGILPFINASIILQLLTAALPQLEDLQKNEGEAGRRKIAQITRYVALGWGLVQSVVFAMILRHNATGIRRHDTAVILRHGAAGNLRHGAVGTEQIEELKKSLQSENTTSYDHNQSYSLYMNNRKNLFPFPMLQLSYA